MGFMDTHIGDSGERESRKRSAMTFRHKTHLDRTGVVDQGSNASTWSAPAERSGDGALAECNAPANQPTIVSKAKAGSSLRFAPALHTVATYCASLTTTCVGLS